MEAAWVVVRLSVSGWVSLLDTELAMVMDRPSSTQAVPRPRTRRVWNGDHRSRSSRAGMVLRIGCCRCGVVTVVMLAPLRYPASDQRDRGRIPRPGRPPTRAAGSGPGLARGAEHLDLLLDGADRAGRAARDGRPGRGGRAGAGRPRRRGGPQ